MNKPVLYTIGHSTRTLMEFMDLLHAYDVSQIVDVRTIPKSRHNPQFNGAELKTSLRQSGIHYRHISKLGGLRHSKKGSKNLGWRNVSFRGFADYMATPAFGEGVDELLRIAVRRVTAIMCAEAQEGHGHHVRGSRALALSSGAHRRCAHKKRVGRPGHHDSDKRATTPAHAVFEGEKRSHTYPAPSA